jgi:hypothetical protein
MHLLQVTITTTAVSQPILSPAVVPGRITPFQQFIPQNNGSNNMRIGDAGVSATRGIIIGPSGSANVAPQLSYSGDLSEFYVNGTAGDVLDILILD